MAVRELVDWCRKCLYLPHITNEQVILAALVNLSAALSAESTFYLADSFNEESARYPGLRALAPLIKPSIALEGTGEFLGEMGPVLDIEKALASMAPIKGKATRVSLDSRWFVPAHGPQLILWKILGISRYLSSGKGSGSSAVIHAGRRLPRTACSPTPAADPVGTWAP